MDIILLSSSFSICSLWRCLLGYLWHEGASAAGSKFVCWIPWHIYVHPSRAPNIHSSYQSKSLLVDRKEGANKCGIFLGNIDKRLLWSHCPCRLYWVLTAWYFARARLDNWLCLDAPCNIFEMKFLHIWSIKHWLITKLITKELVCKLRDEFIKTN